VLRYLHQDVKARRCVPAVAIILDLMVLGGFIWVKLTTDPFVIGVAVATMIVIAITEQIFLKSSAGKEVVKSDESHEHHH
jgi:hypothetical protein